MPLDLVGVFNAGVRVLSGGNFANVMLFCAPAPEGLSFPFMIGRTVPVLTLPLALEARFGALCVSNAGLVGDERSPNA